VALAPAPECLAGTYPWPADTPNIRATVAKMMAVLPILRAPRMSLSEA
jgi:hypothetical protein